MSAGQWVQQVTLGWLLYDMTGSSLLLGALNGVRTLPFLISAPAAGVAADRIDRRRLLLSTQVILLFTALVMGTLVTTGIAEVWHLFVFTLISGITWSFNQPVRHALVPAVVPKQDLMNAVALSSTGFNITKVFAPTIGGLLIALFGAGGNFYVQSATYAGVLAMIHMIHIQPMSKQTEPSSAFVDLKEGLSYVRSNPVILGLVVVSLVSQVFAMPYQTLMPVFQKDVLGVGPEGLGLLLAAPGLGAVLATLLLATLANSLQGKGLVLLWALVMLGICLILFSQTTSMSLALLALVGVGCSEMVFVNLSMTFLQILVPDELRGRVLSIYMLDRGFTPGGALVAGIATSIIGAPTTVAGMGLCVILLALIALWMMPSIRNINI